MILTVTDLAVARGGLALLQGVVPSPSGRGQALALRRRQRHRQDEPPAHHRRAASPAAGRVDGRGRGRGLRRARQRGQDALSVDENLLFWQATYGTELMKRVKAGARPRGAVGQAGTATLGGPGPAPRPRAAGGVGPEGLATRRADRLAGRRVGCAVRSKLLRAHLGGGWLRAGLATHDPDLAGLAGLDSRPTGRRPAHLPRTRRSAAGTSREGASGTRPPARVPGGQRPRARARLLLHGRGPRAPRRGGRTAKCSPPLRLASCGLGRCSPAS